MLGKAKRGDLPNSTAMPVDEDEAVARGCTGERREMPPGESCIFLRVTGRAEMDFQELHGNVDGLGQISPRKAWK